jgi:hypothetical protein
VKRIDELIGEHDPLPPNPYKPRAPSRELLHAPPPTTEETDEPKLYESEVYDYLLTHKDALGISEVFQLKNSSADGEIELDGGGRVLVEIKYAMNWEKACQSTWQLLESFKLMKPLKLSPTPHAGLVFFEHFTADWDKQAVSRPLKAGWYYWYAGHYKLREDFSAMLVHLQRGVLSTYPELVGRAS